MLGQIDDGRYRDRAVQIDLARVTGPDLRRVTNRKDMERDVQVAREDLKRAEEQLEVAENQAGAAQTLREKQSEHSRVDGQLREYDNYIGRWEKRKELQQALTALDQHLASVNALIRTLNTDIASLDRRRQAMETERGAAEDMRRQLSDAAKAYRREEADSSIAAPLELMLCDDGDGEEDDPPAWIELAPRCERMLQRLRSMHENLRVIGRKQGRVGSLQKEIGERSREFEGQAVYFSEADADWDRLVEMVESIGEQHEAVEQLWDSLFKRVGAKLSEVRHGVSEVRLAVNRINSGLASYRVSNLRGVKLEVVVENDTFGLIEALTSDGGIFQDHEKIDRAKEHMRQWIRDGKVIQLDELFAIHIKVHDMDRERPTDARSLDEIGSTGTGMTAKAMVFIQLVRAVVNEDRYRLHFYLDETGQLDERNLGATTRMAVEKGVMPITADPDVRIESLAHPTVTVYSLGQDKSGKFFIDGLRTCTGRLKAADESLEQNA